MADADRPSKVAGAVVVVTGGGNGIGGAIAHRLAEGGARVVVNDLDGDAAQAGGDRGARVRRTGDAASEQAVHDLISAARVHLGGIDIYCANAASPAARDPRPWSQSGSTPRRPT